MRRIFLHLLALMLCAGCTAPGVIMTANIRGLSSRVLDRHDDYAIKALGDADEGSRARQRARIEQESAGSRRLLELDQVEAATLDPMMRPCLDRHDRYVATDDELGKAKRKTYLRSSAILRRVLDEGLKGAGK